MFTEKSRLTDKRENPFYGSYKENNILEELHWKNRQKKRQLTIVSSVILVLALLSIGITLAITLPPLMEKNAQNALDPPDPTQIPEPSQAKLRSYSTAAVSSQDVRCSRIGRDIMEKLNGTVVDAAVAVSLCLGVVAPQSSGIGGGSFLVIYTGNETFALNGREVTPGNVQESDYAGNLSAASHGGKAVGVPGEIAALWKAHQRFGKLPWSTLVKDARVLAQEGFVVSKQLETALKKYEAKVLSDPILRSEFVNPLTGTTWTEGDTIKRTRLGSTLLLLEQNGGNAFYNGTLQTNILKDLEKAGSRMTADDFTGYSADWVTPISYTFSNNLTLYGLPFPSSAAVVALGLGILDGYGKRPLGEMSLIEEGLDAHRLLEAQKFAYAHRSRIGDPEFDDDNSLSQFLDTILSVEYATELRNKIADYQTFEDQTHYGPDAPEPAESGTSHISIIGPNGTAVSLTTSINNGFGAGFMGDLTGIVFNNQIADFDFSNISNLTPLQSPTNRVEGGKRPASSMSPLIFLNQNLQPVLSIGAGGGAKIVPALITTTWRALYREIDIKEATDYPRLMPNFHPSVVHYEYGLPAQLIQDLQRRGHYTKRISRSDHLGYVNSVCRTKRTSVILGHADYRKNGDSAGF